MVDLSAEVAAMIAKKVERPSVQMTDKLAELGLESLDTVELIFDIEEKFKVHVPYNANDVQPGLDTVGDIVRAVEGLVAGKA